MKTKKEITERLNHLRTVRDNFLEHARNSTCYERYCLNPTACEEYAHQLQQIILELKWILN